MNGAEKRKIAENDAESAPKAPEPVLVIRKGMPRPWAWIINARKDQARRKKEKTLMMVANRGTPDALSLLRDLMKTTNPNAVDADGWTALMAAAANSNTHMLMELLPHADKKPVSCSRKFNALMLSIEGPRDMKAVRALIPGSNLRHKNADGDTVLLLAARVGNWDAVGALIEADPLLTSVVTAKGDNALHLLLKAQTILGGVPSEKKMDMRIVEFLPLFDLGAVNAHGETALILISRHKFNLSLAFDKIAQASDVNARDGAGNTALATVARSNHGERAEALLAMGADANILDSKGRSPLRHALAQQNFEAALALLPRSKLPKPSDFGGRASITTLVEAIECKERAPKKKKKKTKILGNSTEELKERGVDVSIELLRGACAHAMNWGFWDLAEALAPVIDKPTVDWLMESMGDQSRIFMPKWRAFARATSEAREICEVWSIAQTKDGVADKNCSAFNAAGAKNRLAAKETREEPGQPPLGNSKKVQKMKPKRL